MSNITQSEHEAIKIVMAGGVARLGDSLVVTRTDRLLIARCGACGGVTESVPLARARDLYGFLDQHRH